MKMLKLEKIDSYVILQTIEAKTENNKLKLVKSNRFYLSKNKINKLHVENIIDNDCYNFLQIYNNNNNTLKLTFTWLNSEYNNKITGTMEYIDIDLKAFNTFMASDSIKTKILIKEQKTNCKINLYSKKIAELIKDKKLKKEFTKICMHIINDYYCSIVNIFDDNVNNFNFNFYFTKYKKDTFISNGGIIYSNYDKDVKKHCYSIHP
jgi:hypothetical protein